MVFATVLLGGITRLTESGLSIVNWRPVTGWLPPLSDADWAALFDAYRSSPEFRQLNFWMTVDDFKTIFWLEYLHRLWGRLIGVVFLLPFLWFVLRYSLPRRLTGTLFLYFLLGGAQGVLGWFMVRSGLADEPSVSQYRLAAHLLLAVAIYALMLRTAIRLRREADGRPPAADGFATAAGWFAGLVFVAMTWGALLAGIDGGAVYNTFPSMNGYVVPPEWLALRPLWSNFFENAAAVQFVHRLLGYLIVAAALALWLFAGRRVRNAAARRPYDAIALLAGLQFCLGVATVLSGAQIWLAWAHQAGAMFLITAAVWAAASPRAPAPDAVRAA